jgi:hypothetical protein
VGGFFAGHPDVDIVIGGSELVYEDERRRDVTLVPRQDIWDLLPAHNGIVQPSCFWRRRIMEREPLLDESFEYAVDLDLWCCFKDEGARVEVIGEVLSKFIQSGRNKTATGGVRIGREMDRIYRAHSKDRIPLSFWYRHLRYPFELALRRDRGMLRLAVLGLIQVLYMAIMMPFYGFRRVFYMSWPE